MKTMQTIANARLSLISALTLAICLHASAVYGLMQNQTIAERSASAQRIVMIDEQEPNMTAYGLDSVAIATSCEAGV